MKKIIIILILGILGSFIFAQDNVVSSFYIQDPTYSYTETHFQLQYLRAFHSAQDLNIYLGLGPELGLNYLPKGIIWDMPIRDYYSEWYKSYWNLTLGLQGLIGAEYYIVKSLSAIAVGSLSSCTTSPAATAATNSGARW